MTTTTRPASDKQIAFARNLISDRVVSEGAVQRLDDLIATGASMRDMSALIDLLLTFDRKPLAHEDGGATGEGYYLSEDEVYVVVKAKTTGNLYAKRLVGKPEGGIEWEYTPGGMRHLTTATRLTVEQAAATGRLHGACIICGALLTDPESVERGIGPVCAARL